MDSRTSPETAARAAATQPSDPAADLDRTSRAHLARATSGISQIGAHLAFADWLAHLAISPGKQLSLAVGAFEAVQKTSQAALEASAAMMTRVPTTEAPTPHARDRRFKANDWSKWPYNVIADQFVTAEQQWSKATTGVVGVSEKNERIVSNSVRMWLDMFSPSNFPWLNPEVIEATKREGGQNFVRGAKFLFEDTQKVLRHQTKPDASEYKVGEKVAVTPGKVVFRNHLIELIQYSPSTDSVHAEPVLIVPAWIMKYYILDLSPHNSMVKYLVDQGHTVFMISWKNPTAEDRDLGMDDYRRDGVMAAIDVVSNIVPKKKIHTAGYCLGGTMLSIAAATMAREHDDRLASVTLFAAQTDFSEAGDLMLFITESEVAMLEAMMWEHGVLDSTQMAGAFQLLRSNELIWSRVIKEYMMGHRDDPNDLMSWNSDATRMPYRMHTEYLTKLFLRNELARGHFEVDGKPIWLNDIHVPYFVVGTAADHVAPWKSVYKAHLSPNEITFVLTSGGHNAGIVSEPGHPHRQFQVLTRTAGGDYVDPDTWVQLAPTREGSWWPMWHEWMAARSTGMVKPPRMGLLKGDKNLPDAPGDYVFQY